MSPLQQGGAQAELVTVSIGECQYAIDIMAVREIRGWSPSTPLPHAPHYVLGMINLRGAILPVVDLGQLLGLGVTAAGNASVVVVVDVRAHQIGVLVDAVCDIIQVKDDALQPAPEVGAQGARAVDGLLSMEEGIVSVLSLENLLPDLELAA